MAHASSAQSDRNWTLTIAILTVIALLALVLGNNFTRQKKSEQRELREQAQALEVYKANTTTPPPPPQVSEKLEAQRRMQERLIQHPAVTPGPGFNAPGVQSTGVVIIDALDKVQP